MTPTGLCRQLTAVLVFSTVMLTAIVASAQSPTRTPDWVNIKDPKFGAIGNGIHDDTAAIQAAIDYAFAHKLPGVYCPAGTYETTSTIYLDPPGNLRTNPTNPPLAQFSMSFFGDPASGAVHLSGCILQPTFNNSIAFLVGTGNSMRVSDIAVVGPNNVYRGNLNPSGVGIGIACGSGGGTGTLIEDTYVRYFYANYKTCAMGNGALSDSNTFRKVAALNGYKGIWIAGTQAYVDDIVEPYMAWNTITIDSDFSKQVNVFGGNLSSVSSASNAFTMSAVSASNCGALSLCVTATIASPDSNIPNVYNAYTILTPHYGLIPFTLTSWNASTNVIQLQALASWETTNYGPNSYWYNNNIWNELDTTTTLYAAERVYTAYGQGIQIDGSHIENDQSCTALFVSAAVWGGQTSNSIKDPFFDYDLTEPQNASVANKYCQLAFPFISSGGGPLRLIGGSWGLPTSASQPILMDIGSPISGRHLMASSTQYPRFNIMMDDKSNFGQIGQSWEGGYPLYQLATVTRGAGTWDADYFLPQALAEGPTSASTVAGLQLNLGELMTNYCGDEPCPSSIPNLSPTLFALVCPGAVSGSPNAYGDVVYTCKPLGSIGGYPPIPSRVIFKSLDWNMGAPNKLFLHSGHGSTVPGWSYGQNLTQTSMGSTPNAVITGSISGQSLTVTGVTSGSLAPGDTITGNGIAAGTVIIAGSGGLGTYTLNNSQSVTNETITAPSVAWAYDRGSSDLYVDATIMRWMFPGLGISIDNGSGTMPYTVTGVYPALGYVTVVWAGNALGNAGGNSVGLQGANPQIYSCASNCMIGQAPFAWTAY